MEHTRWYRTDVKTFTEIDFDTLRSMTADELYEVSRYAYVAASKRVANIRKAFGDDLSPGALKFVEEGAGKFSKNPPAGMDEKEQKNYRNIMISRVRSMQRFLAPPELDDDGKPRMSTRTVRDYKKYLKHYSEKLSKIYFSTPDGKISYDELTEEQRKSLWNFIDDARSVKDWGTSKEMGSDAFIKAMSAVWARSMNKGTYYSSDAYPNADERLYHYASEKEVEKAYRKAYTRFKMELNQQGQ